MYQGPKTRRIRRWGADDKMDEALGAGQEDEALGASVDE